MRTLRLETLEITDRYLKASRPSSRDESLANADASKWVKPRKFRRDSADRYPVSISIRDEKGQAVIEYILVLIVAIAIIFGGLYQLNSAFKAWATNYFGDYLSCLLETGELPSIGGTGGDPGLCNQLFKPFTIGEGRRLAGVQASKGDGESKKSSAAGASERGNLSRLSKDNSGGGAGGARGYGGTSFSGGKGFGKNAPPNAGPGMSKLDQPAASKGNNYGNAFTGYNSKQAPSRIKLDQRFMMDEQRERKQSAASSFARTPADSVTTQGSKKITYTNTKKAEVVKADTGLTVADFLRYLLIAGIIVALLVFLGGQALQIGKSMD